MITELWTSEPDMNLMAVELVGDLLLPDCARERLPILTDHVGAGCRFCHAGGNEQGEDHTHNLAAFKTLPPRQTLRAGHFLTVGLVRNGSRLRGDKFAPGGGAAPLRPARIDWEETRLKYR